MEVERNDGSRAPDVAATLGELEPLQRELLQEEALAIASAVSDPERRSRYRDLAQSAKRGTLPEELLGAAEDLLELGLESGRFRRRYTAEGEQALLGLYRRTPRGAAVQATVAHVNRALAGVAGRTLREVAFTARAPGEFGIALTTDAGRLALRVGRAGVRIESVEVGE
jgi:hypothetical protein